MSAALFRRWFEEVWNQRRDATIDELFAPDGVGHGLPITGRGPASFRPFHKQLLAIFPKLKIDVEETVESGPDADGITTVAGRFTGYVATPDGREGTLPCACFSRWRKGQIVESWNLVDWKTLEKQIGPLGF